jgi:hypothetical protein
MYYDKEKIYDDIKRYLKVKTGDSVSLADFKRALRVNTTITKEQTMKRWFKVFKDLSWMKSEYIDPMHLEMHIFFLK